MFLQKSDDNNIRKTRAFVHYSHRTKIKKWFIAKLPYNVAASCEAYNIFFYLSRRASGVFPNPFVSWYRVVVGTKILQVVISSASQSWTIKQINSNQDVQFIKYLVQASFIINKWSRKNSAFRRYSSKKIAILCLNLYMCWHLNSFLAVPVSL